MTPAEELRQAATTIRSRAAKASPGPWTVDSETYAETIHDRDHNSVVAGGRWGGEASVFSETADAIHIALWDPDIAELVAVLFDGSADHWDTRPGVHHQYFDGLPLANLARAINTKAGKATQ